MFGPLPPSRARATGLPSRAGSLRSACPVPRHAASRRRRAIFLEFDALGRVARRLRIDARHDARRPHVRPPAPPPAARAAIHGAVSEFKRRLIEATLHQMRGNRTHTARALGLQRTYLLRLIREFGVSVPPPRTRRPTPTAGPRRQRRRPAAKGR